MLQLAMVRHKHTPQNSLYVGDRPEDEQAAQRVGVPFQWAWDWTCATSRGDRTQPYRSKVTREDSHGTRDYR
jgi:D-glycero-D-manno-heptose 1,7-bisphosphate phosphatase